MEPDFWSQLLSSLAIVLVGVSVGGCNGVQSTANKSSIRPQSDSASGKSRTDRSGKATIGDTIRFRNGEERYWVTLDQVLQLGSRPVRSGRQAAKLVGVALTMRAAADNRQDFTVMGTSLINSRGRAYADVPFTASGCSHSDVVQIDPGTTREVCIPFRIPLGTEPERFRLLLSSPISSGEWEHLARAQTSNADASPHE